MIIADLAEIEDELVRIADDVGDGDEWGNYAGEVEKLRDLARRIAVVVETAKLRAA